MIKIKACNGCRNSFYNGRQNIGGSTRCWSAEKGTMVTRYRIYYLTEPTEKGAFTEVTVPSCYHQASGYCFYEKLPDFVKAEDLNRAKRAATT